MSLKSVLVFSFLLVFSLTASAKETSTGTDTKIANSVIQVRGRDSVIEELNIGPDATDFLMNVIFLSQNIDYLNDYRKISKLLQLTVISELHDTLSSDLAPTIWVELAAEPRHYIIERVIYAEATDFYNKDQKYLKLSLALNLNDICISATEIRKHFGNGVIGIPSHGGVPKEFYSMPAGISFSEAYGETENFTARAPFIFSYVNSGCLKSVQLQKRLPIDNQ